MGRGSRGSPPYDYARTLRLVTYGLVIGTPMAFKWYEFLDKHVMADHPTSATAVVVKMLLDQLLMCPVGTAMFLVGMRIMEGRSVRTAWQAMTTKLLSVLKANYMVWPAAHIINFSLIPSSQRILYLNCIGVLWGAMLAKMAMEPVKTVSSVPGANGSAVKDVDGDVRDLRVKSS